MRKKSRLEAMSEGYRPGCGGAIGASGAAAGALAARAATALRAAGPRRARATTPGCARAAGAPRAGPATAAAPYPRRAFLGADAGVRRLVAAAALLADGEARARRAVARRRDRVGALRSAGAAGA